jgi:hypothetical protein
MNTFTPGPWGFDAEVGTVEHESGMLICTLSTSDGFPCLTEDEDKSEEEVRAEVDAECKANGHLIAAAPELLEALGPFARLANIILAEAPPDAKTVVLFTSAAGEKFALRLDQLRSAQAAIAKANPPALAPVELHSNEAV